MAEKLVDSKDGVLAVDVTLSPVDFADEFPKRVFKLTKSDWTVQIGRSSKNDTKNLASRADNAFVDSPVMSRRHASLFLENGVYVVDNASTHGTLLNDDRLPKEVPMMVKDGDVLTFGCPVARGEDTFPARSFRVNLHSHMAPPKAATPASTFSVPEETTSDEESNATSEQDPHPVLWASDESDQDSLDDFGDSTIMPATSLVMANDNLPLVSPEVLVTGVVTPPILEWVSPVVGTPNVSTNPAVNSFVAKEDTEVEVEALESEDDSLPDPGSGRFLKDDANSDRASQSVSEDDSHSDRRSRSVSEDHEASPESHDVLDLTTEDEAVSTSESSQASSVEISDDDGDEEDEEEPLFVPMSPVNPTGSQAEGESQTAAPAKKPLAANRMGGRRLDGSKDHPLVIVDDEHERPATSARTNEQDRAEKNPALSISHVLLPADERQQPATTPAPPVEQPSERLAPTPTFAPPAPALRPEPYRAPGSTAFADIEQAICTSVGGRRALTSTSPLDLAPRFQAPFDLAVPYGQHLGGGQFDDHSSHAVHQNMSPKLPQGPHQRPVPHFWGNKFPEGWPRIPGHSAVAGGVQDQFAKRSSGVGIQSPFRPLPRIPVGEGQKVLTQQQDQQKLQMHRANVQQLLQQHQVQAMRAMNLAIVDKTPLPPKSKEPEKDDGEKKVPEAKSSKDGKETASKVNNRPWAPIWPLPQGITKQQSSIERPALTSLKRKAVDEMESLWVPARGGFNPKNSIHSATDDQPAKKLPDLQQPEARTNSEMDNLLCSIRRTTAELRSDLLTEPPPRKRVKTSDSSNGRLSQVKSAAKMLAGAAVAGVTVFAYLAGSNPDPI